MSLSGAVARCSWWIVAFACPATLLSVAPFALAGQTAGPQPADLRIRIEAAAGSTIRGALVALVDAEQRVHSERLSSESGHVTLRAVPGQYRIRIRRIGYRPFYSGPVDLPHEGEIILRVESPRVVLAAMVVKAENRCGPISNDAATLSEVWEEIAKALRASQITSADLSTIGESRMYRREVNKEGDVLSGDSSVFQGSRGRPFGAIDPASLVADGYVRGNERRGWQYFGPDETVLLSRGFAETHCFRIVRDPRRRGELGLAFAPVASRKKSDIDGVLWLDEETSELREITFRYVNVETASRFEPRGFTRFQRMPSGAWIVREWQLRMPILERPPNFPQIIVTGYVESGGRVLLNTLR